MRYLRVLTLLPVLSVAVCCSTPPVKIGVVLELSGDASVYGQSVRNAIELAVEEINQTGGIRNHRLVAVYRDAKSDPEEGLRAVRELVEEENIRVVIGAVTSSVTLAIGRYCQENHVILLSPAASSPQISYLGDFVFRNFPSDRLEGFMMAHFMMERMGVKDVAVIYIDNDYGRDLYQVFTSEFVRMGGKLLAVFRYRVEERDFTSIAARLAKIRPTAVYLIGYAPDMVTFLRQLRSQYTPPWIFSVSAFGVPSVLSWGGPDVEGVIFFQPAYDPHSADPRVQTFVQRYFKAFGSIPDIYAAHGYDAVMILAQTMRLFGFDVNDIQLGLTRTHNFRGVAGPTSFNQDGDVLRFPRPYIVENGRFIPLDEARIRILLELRRFR